VVEATFPPRLKVGSQANSFMDGSITSLLGSMTEYSVLWCVPSIAYTDHLDRDGVTPSTTTDWVTSRTLPSDTAEGLRRAVMDDLMSTVGATCGMYHGVAIVDGAFYFENIQVFGDMERMAFLGEFSGRPIADYADLTPASVSAINSFTEVTDEEFRSNRGYGTMWVPMECISVIAMGAVVGGILVGWVGAHRVAGETYFGAEVVRRVQPRADAYVHCLDMAHSLEGAGAGERGIVLFTAGGDASFACQTGRAWLRDGTLLARIRTALAAGEPCTPFFSHGAIVRITPLTGATGDQLHCAEIAPLSAWQVPELVRLSVQQRRVAELAAVGATVPEIARALGLSASTVRTYLRKVYDSLGIATRLELAEAVRSIAASA
jgi:DNA-binding NarL/FixJ family response regulator